MNQMSKNLKKIWQGNYTGIAHIMLQLQQLLHSQARAFIYELHSRARAINTVIDTLCVQLPYNILCNYIVTI